MSAVTERRDKVLYIGAFELPGGNAAARRVLGNAKLLRALGHETVFLHQKAGVQESVTSYCGFECHEFPTTPGRGTLLRGLWDTGLVERVLKVREDIGVLIAYNYPAIALARLRVYCRARGILCLADVADWYGSRGRSLAYKVVKGLDTILRMRVIHKRLDGLIVVSSYLERYYDESVPIVRIPPLYDLTDGVWLSPPVASAESGVTLVYAGSPSNEKERLDLLVAAVLSIASRHNVILHVVGITRKQYQHMYRASPQLWAEDHSEDLAAENGAIVFHGRVSHEMALDFVRRANYTVLVRESNRVTMAGFPTKFVESIACGTPVIANDSSDLAAYLYGGQNGFLVSLGALQADLERIVGDVHTIQVNRDLFDYHAYEPAMREFLSVVSAGGIPDMRPL